MTGKTSVTVRFTSFRLMGAIYSIALPGSETEDAFVVRYGPRAAGRAVGALLEETRAALDDAGVSASSVRVITPGKAASKQVEIISRARKSTGVTGLSKISRKANPEEFLLLHQKVKDLVTVGSLDLRSCVPTRVRIDTTDQAPLSEPPDDESVSFFDDFSVEPRAGYPGFQDMQAGCAPERSAFAPPPSYDDLEDDLFEEHPRSFDASFVCALIAVLFLSFLFAVISLFVN